MGRLSHRLDSQAVDQTLYLSGDVDEHADFNQIKIVSTAPLTIDLAQVHHVNSMGVRLWVNWVKTLPKVASAIRFRNCPRVVVQQLNVLKGFLPGNSLIDSLMVPFYCQNCEQESEYLAKRGEDYLEKNADQDAHVKMQLDRPCPTCGEIESADIIPENYFKFLKGV